MLKITATNAYNNSLQVTQNSLFRVTAEGLNPPPGTIYTAEMASKNGSLYNTSRVNNRNIILHIWPAGRNTEAARLELYKVFKVSKFVRLHIQTPARDCTAEGYIEDMPSDFDQPAQEMPISIICPDPFLIATTATEKTLNTAGTAETINNTGDFESGAVFEITATGAVEGLTISNATTGESFGIAVTLAAGDKVTLNTKQGEKALYLTRSGQAPVNALNLMTDGSAWPILQPGNNSVAFTATSGGANASMKVTFSALYGGI